VNYPFTGADPATFAFVMEWKHQLWFVERNSGRAWYLPAGQLFGAAACINFGNRLRYGGTLIGLWKWTTDGGTGPDDFLVGISTAGDVLIYQGTDPNSAVSFGTRGTWFCGAMPAGRRVATDQGGDLLLLTSLGVLPLSRLVGGSEKLDPNVYSSRKIRPLLADYMTRRGSLRGWSIQLHPSLNAIMVVIPEWSGQPSEQLVMSMASAGWSLFRGLPVLSAETWQGALYFGTADGRVCVNTGVLDDIDVDGVGGTEIESSFLTAFRDFGSAGFKQAQMVRLHFATDGNTPSYGVRTRYDFDVAERTAAYSRDATGGAAAWGTAIWDESYWVGLGTLDQPIGVSGMGHAMALEVMVKSKCNPTIVGLDLSVESGGVL
jgi:hypothetical protein